MSVARVFIGLVAKSESNNKTGPIHLFLNADRVSICLFTPVILVFLLWLTASKASAQEYLHDPDNDLTAHTCSGSYYDSGGASGDYGNQEEGTYTFTSTPYTVSGQSKIEYRTDDDSEQIDQWVLTNRLAYSLNDNLRLAARFNYAKTEDGSVFDPVADEINQNSEFVEAGLGFSWRPSVSDKLNILGRYTYLYDLRSPAQRTPDIDQLSHVLSIEGIYRINRRWETAIKLAHRLSELRVDQQQGAWFDSSASLVAVQGRYHLVNEWDALAEYRWLSVQDESARHGLLLGVSRQIGDHLELGMGYNFTDFVDDLTKVNDYEYKGWYVNMIGKY